MKHVLSALPSLSVAIFLCAVTWFVTVMWSDISDRPPCPPPQPVPLMDGDNLITYNNWHRDRLDVWELIETKASKIHDPAIESVVHRKDCLDEWELGDNLTAYNNNPKAIITSGAVSSGRGGTGQDFSIAERNLCWNSELSELAPCNTWTDPSKP